MNTPYLPSFNILPANAVHHTVIVSNGGTGATYMKRPLDKQFIKDMLAEYFRKYGEPFLDNGNNIIQGILEDVIDIDEAYLTVFGLVKFKRHEEYPEFIMKIGHSEDSIPTATIEIFYGHGTHTFKVISVSDQEYADYGLEL